MQIGNVDHEVVAGFGDEWTRFDQSALSERELRSMFDDYFKIFPWNKLPENSIGFDLGCGSGRWAKFVAPKVGELHLIDPSSAALTVAKRNLDGAANCQFHLATVDMIPLSDLSCDFGYCLGVLHHIPDTEAGLRACVSKLKRGAPFLLYLYYRFDNRPAWFRLLWNASEVLRLFVSRMPHSVRNVLSQVIAGLIYYPLSRFALACEKFGFDVSSFPLTQYRKSSFYVMRNDALDRFGTRLERRFTKSEIEDLMTAAGLKDIQFSDKAFWTAVGFKAG